MRETWDKFRTIIEKNTFYFYNPIFQEEYVRRLFQEKELGLDAVLALTGLSKEFIQRLITIIRAVDDSELSKITYKSKWYEENQTEVITEWSKPKVNRLLRENEYFRNGIVNIFFEGATVPFLAKTLPLFELKKLSITKLNFDTTAMLDTLIRYKEKVFIVVRNQTMRKG